MMAGIKTVEDARVGDTITIEAESRRAEGWLRAYESTHRPIRV